jgi:putative ABC transport system substrate-binding protein
MRRRNLLCIGILGGAASWPLAARAQQAGKLPTIGFLGPSTAAADVTRRAALLQRLGELGWVEGRSVHVEYRWGEGAIARAGEIAAEFVRLKVDVIVTSGDAQILAVKRTTAEILIIIAAAADPVGSGLVESLARPGGNVTGLSRQLIDTTGKRLELLQEIVPGLRRLASCSMPPIPSSSWSSTQRRQPPARWVSMSSGRKSGAPTTFRPRSSSSRAAPTRSMSASTRS